MFHEMEETALADEAFNIGDACGADTEEVQDTEVASAYAEEDAVQGGVDADEAESMDDERIDSADGFLNWEFYEGVQPKRKPRPPPHPALARHCQRSRSPSVIGEPTRSSRYAAAAAFEKGMANDKGGYYKGGNDKGGNDKGGYKDTDGGNDKGGYKDKGGGKRRSDDGKGGGKRKGGKDKGSEGKDKSEGGGKDNGDERRGGARVHAASLIVAVAWPVDSESAGCSFYIYIYIYIYIYTYI